VIPLEGAENVEATEGEQTKPDTEITESWRHGDEHVLFLFSP